MRILCTFISLLIILNSCKTNSEFFNDFPELNGMLKDNSNIYVIPGSGCTGCISDMEQFALNNKGNNVNYFIFTRIKSVKLFKVKFSEIWNSPNTIIDSLNKFNYPDEAKSIYPVKFSYSSNNFKIVKYYEP